MPTFSYQVRDDAGVPLAGMVDAGSMEEASRILRRDGKTIIQLRPESEEDLGVLVKPRKVRSEDLMYFTNQLAVMVDTGLPLTEALDSIAEETTHNGLKKLVLDIAGQVKGGIEFSKALAEHPKVFPDLYVNMVAASETSGTMGAMLERLCEYMRSQRETRKQVAGAMYYPVGMMVFSLLIVTLMMMFVLPRFEKIYAGKQAVLPAPTRALLAVGNTMNEYWMVIAAGVVATVAGIWIYVRSDAGRYRADALRLRLPALGGLHHKMYIARSLRTLSTMLSSGVEVLEAIRITANVAGNSLYRNMWLHVAEQLRQGKTLSEEMAETTLIPSGVAQMISCGDRSGRLSDVLDRISRFCEDDLKVGVKAMTTLIEPTMIVLMGFLVGGIALALLLPVFNISKIMAH